MLNQADIAHLFAYTDWANALVLNAAEQLTPEQLHHDFRISYGTIFGTLLHMAGAEWIWCERWQGRSPSGPNAWGQWQAAHCPDVATLRTRWLDAAAARRDLLANFTAADLQQERAFRRVDGTENSLPLVAQMQHVVNHATLHRGQVVGMIRQLGLTPPATDLLFYLVAQKAGNA